MQLKLGRKPAQFDRRAMRSALVLAEALGELGPAPSISNDYVSAVDRSTGGDWGMLGNDQFGDCTFADSGHQIMLHTANAGSIYVPSSRQVLDAYAVCTGFRESIPSSDQGAVEADVCTFMQRTGLAGHKSSGFGSIEPSNLDHVKWAVQIFGACRIGINLTQGMMDQFSRGQIWDVGGDQTPIGGHDVPIVRYDHDYVWVVTWAKCHPMTYACFAKICEEAHAEVYEDWIKSTGVAPSGLNVSQMLAYLNQL
jgi:hypothetical protein